MREFGSSHNEDNLKVLGESYIVSPINFHINGKEISASKNQKRSECILVTGSKQVSSVSSKNIFPAFIFVSKTTANLKFFQFSPKLYYQLCSCRWFKLNLVLNLKIVLFFDNFMYPFLSLKGTLFEIFKLTLKLYWYKFQYQGQGHHLMYLLLLL